MKKEFILFGASGDLARQKLYPALFHLFGMGESMRYVGFARSELTAVQFYDIVRASVLATDVEVSPAKLDAFVSAWTYVSGTYDASGIGQIAQVEGDADSIERFFYLSIPSGVGLIMSVVRGLKEHNLINARSAIVLEKPFGLDYASAKNINSFLLEHFTEEQIFRIDHYLAKDLVQDLLALRFANPIFEPVWNGKYIDRMTIEIKETEGIRNRGQYYDQSGAMRDMIQNHALQLLAFSVMNQPKNISAESIHREKIAVLEKIRLWDDGKNAISIGQYVGYRNEPYVAPLSQTETKASLTVCIDTPAWRTVPITITSGKKMDKKTTDITIYFKKRPHSMWDESGCSLDQNVIRVNVAPDNDIRLTLNSEFDLQKKCAFPTELRFGFRDNAFILNEPYENALRDLFAKDQSIFINSKEIALSWKFIDNVLERIALLRAEILETY
ncbi:MAG: glucose-6-phosphate dehydrogenase [Candidatus Moranbacteria bacterium]|nr:glucose-6-phosphate dehydrogenase [Candidatus Moranbacteria bacterium]